MMMFLKKFLYVYAGSTKNLILLVSLFVITSVLEAVGIGLIGPFFAIAANPDLIQKSYILTQSKKYFYWLTTQEFILLIGISIVAVFVVKSISYFFSKVYIYSVIFNQRKILQIRLFKTYINSSYEFSLNYNSSDLTNKIAVETSQFTYTCALPLLEIIANSAIIFSLILLLGHTSINILMLLLVVLGGVAFLFSRFSNRFRAWGKSTSIARENILKSINHSIGGLKELKVIGCGEYFENEIGAAAQNMTNSEILFRASQYVPRILLETILISFFIIFISVSQLQNSNSFNTSVISAMSVFAVAGIRLIPSASLFIQSTSSISNSSYILDKLYLGLKEIEWKNKFRISTPTHPESRIKSHSLEFTKYFQLNNITYRYPNAENESISDVSLTVPKGQAIALIGKSGAGKTTLVDIILTLLKPQRGDIKVDGISIYDHLIDWQKLLGYIPQSIFLMDDTIEHNIAFGELDNNIDHDRLWESIQLAQLESLIFNLPDGIKTKVGERGVRLSGGQRQRIGIARALYFQREILVLDEATSALDNETEKLVSQSIRALAGSKTLIIVAHRLTTVEHCDQIYVMENGRIVHCGSYLDVVAV